MGSKRVDTRDWVDRHADHREWRLNKGKEYNREIQKRARSKLRKQLLEHYGGNPPKCSCCGEITNVFLCIDHIDGGGNEHRRVAGGTDGFWRKLRKEGFPPGYQVLCHNCNFAKHTLGECPHQLEGVTLADTETQEIKG